MEWIYALKGLVSAKIKSLIQFTAKTHVKTKRNSDNKTSSVTVNVNGNVNVFNITPNKDGLVDATTLKQLQDVILPAFEANEILLIEDESKQLLHSYKEFRDEPGNAELLEFFKGKVPQSDVTLLESGLYEAHLIATGQLDKAQQVKEDIIKRYGQRGKNIINLASAGYYATHIKPLYEALQDQGLSDTFLPEYNQIIDEMPFAIFVHSGITKEKALELLYEKAETNIQYGVREDTIILNGFGPNAERIESLIPTLNNKYQRVASTVTYLGDLKTVQVAVYYREVKH